MFDELTNDGMIAQMYHEWTRYKKVNYLQINMGALWQKWIRA